MADRAERDDSEGRNGLDRLPSEAWIGTELVPKPGFQTVEIRLARTHGELQWPESESGRERRCEREHAGHTRPVLSRVAGGRNGMQPSYGSEVLRGKKTDATVVRHRGAPQRVRSQQGENDDDAANCRERQLESLSSCRTDSGRTLLPHRRDRRARLAKSVTPPTMSTAPPTNPGINQPKCGSSTRSVRRRRAAITMAPTAIAVGANDVVWSCGSCDNPEVFLVRRFPTMRATTLAIRKRSELMSCSARLSWRLR